MRIIIALIFIIILAGFNNACQSPFDDNFEKQFVINDTINIRSIQITGNNNFILKRMENGWVLSDGAAVNQVAINNLLLSLTRLEKLAVIKNFEPADSSQIFFSIETPKKQYSFSFSFSENTAYIGKMESEEVYRFGIKGLPGINIKDIFSDTETHWKNPLIIDYCQNNIKQISVTPSSDWGDAFKISKIGEEWILFDAEGLEGYTESVDREKLIDYTRNFMGIFFDKEIIDKHLYDKSVSMEPFFSIKIETFTDKELLFNIYPSYNDNGEYDDFYALMTKSESESLYLVNYVYLDPMFESYASFLRK